MLQDAKEKNQKICTIHSVALPKKVIEFEKNLIKIMHKQNLRFQCLH